jgi:ABC-type polysaccharide/polyol phosphate transport system ATPase subunit
MMKTGTISFENVSKRYRLGNLGTLRGVVAGLFERRNGSPQSFWALQDVSFHVESGESLGLIGPNGAGKTTTLKLLSNITRPTKGQVVVSGRYASLIELGAGFHPELTGLENIYLNGAILGLKRHRIAEIVDDIIAFSELERFMDTPVKHYSSGMYVRLGFAIAAHTEPDVLLVDEVLAVGDASFRQRCIKRMETLRQKGTTVVFISHNMYLVRRMCDNAILLMDGKVRSRGATEDVIADYESLLAQAALEGNRVNSGSSTSTFGELEDQNNLMLKKVEVLSPETAGADPSILRSEQPVKVKIHYHAFSPQEIGRVDLRILRSDSTLCCTADSSRARQGSEDVATLNGSGVIEATYDSLQLTSGDYVAVVAITDVSDAGVIASNQSQPFHVLAKGGGGNRGVFIPRVTWANRPRSKEMT